MPGRPSLFVYLSFEEEQELRDLLRHPRTPTVTRGRIHVVLSSHDNRSPSEIARTSHLSRPSVYNVLNAFLHRRLESLFVKDRPGRTPSVTPEMETVILECVRDEAIGYNATTLGEVLERRFGVSLATQTLHAHLKRMGLSWQRSRSAPGGEPEPEAAAETVARLEGLKRGRWQG